ncbi:adenylate/guanylate cyclase domain-containing protein [Ensifer sp. NBAIM29]|nr:adenylate/guanylate cyclase domain-containing protein [Ensifer sp. NBAIM29]
MERKLTAILAADVVGFSRLVGMDEAGTLADLRAHRDNLIDPKIAEHGGHIVKTIGDGLLVVFSSVVAAVECAAAIQRGMVERNRDVPGHGTIEFRIGVNLGEVVVEGTDIFGDGVNIASRLESIAEPGMICVSGAVFSEVKNRVKLRFEDLGAQPLKNIVDPVHVYRIVPAAGGPEPRHIPRTTEEMPIPKRPSIAVLPFADFTGKPDHDYLADGLRLNIQAALIHASGLFLIGAATCNRYRNADVTAEQAGRELGVRYVLQGAVQKSGQRIRAMLELTDVVARQIVWAERYDRLVDDAFAMQDEITAEVLKALDVKLASGEKWLLHSTISNLEALDPFYRGLSLFYAGSREANAAAREMFETVFRLQPDSPVGPAYLCFTFWVDAFRGWAASKEQSLAQAALWADKAIKLRGSNGLAHIVLASVHLLNRRHEEALATCYKAVELRPNCPTANSYLANILCYCGRPSEAIAKVQEAMRITPVFPPWYMTLLAAAYRDTGEIAKSISAAGHSLKLNPGDCDALLVLCSNYSLLGQRQQAGKLAQEIVAIEPKFSLGRYAESQPYKDEEALARLIESLRAAGLPQ